MKKKTQILNLIFPVATAGALIVVWAIVARAVDSEYVLPSVSLTLEKFGALIIDGKFYLAFFGTVLRSLIAFIFSFVVAFVLGVLRCKLSTIKSVFDTVMSVVRSLPTIAVILLILFWTNSKVAPVIVSVLVVLPTT